MWSIFFSEKYGHAWYITIWTKNKETKHRLRISKEKDSGWADILIGKEESFDKMERQYMMQYRHGFRYKEYSFAK